MMGYWGSNPPPAPTWGWIGERQNSKKNRLKYSFWALFSLLIIVSISLLKSLELFTLMRYAVDRCAKSIKGNPTDFHQWRSVLEINWNDYSNCHSPVPLHSW